MGALRLYPIREGFLTDTYGQDSYSTVWGISEAAGTQFKESEAHNAFELARQFFYWVNERYPQANQYGEQAEKLDLDSWSIYDPQYTPLRKRLEQCCAYL